MSHSSGIPVSAALLDIFGDARVNGGTRLIKAQIVNDEIAVITTQDPTADWEADLGKVKALLDVDAPSYILFRLDSKNEYGYEWALLCYVPDKSKVKDKMVYASTRANLKNQLGTSYFTDEVFGTVPGDFSKEGYAQHKTAKRADAPLTWAEQEAKAEKSVTSQDVFTSSGNYVHGVEFPVEPEVLDAMTQFKNKTINYVQLGVDLEKEKITLKGKATIDIENLPDKIPIDEARFHYFMYSHNYEGANVDSVVFVYSCPDGSDGTKSTPVRMRMLYSSSKSNAATLATKFGLTVSKMFEVTSPKELSADSIHEQIHPKKEEEKKGFAKPSRPGKGGRTLIRK